MAKESCSSGMLLEEEEEDNPLEDEEPTLVDILGIKKTNDKNINLSKNNVSQMLNLPKLEISQHIAKYLEEK